MTEAIQSVSIDFGIETDGAVAKINKLVSAVQGLGGSGTTQSLKTIRRGILSVTDTMSAAWNETRRLCSRIVGSGPLSDLMRGMDRLKSKMVSLGISQLANTAVKSIKNALSEGLKNAYQFSAGIETEAHRFAAAMDSMKLAGGTMKNQIGSAFISLLAIISPIVNTIVALISRLAVALSQLFAAFTGGTYLRAKKLNSQMASDTAGGAAAAKEWKNQLLGFDEINRLEAPASGGGGGGGGGGIDLDDLFEEVEIDKSLKDFVDAFKEALANGDWEGAGKMLADKINELVNKVDWEGLGKKLGEKIEAVVQVAYAFLKLTDFQNIGAKIAAFINSAGDQINFNTLGRLVTRIKTALWDVLYGALINVDWAAWGKRLSEYVTGRMDELAEWISGLDPDKIAKAIEDFFGNIDYEGIKESFFNLILTAWDKAIALKDAIFGDEEKKAEITTAIKGFFGGLSWDEIREVIKTNLASAWQWISGKFDEIWPPEERNKIKEAFKTQLNNLLQEAINLIDFAGLWELLKSKIKEALLNPAKEESEAVTNTVDNALAEVGTTSEGIVDVAAAAATDTQTQLDAITDAAASTSSTVLGEAETIVDETGTAFDNVISKSGDTETALDGLDVKANGVVGSLVAVFQSGEAEIVNDLGIVITKSEGTGSAFHDLAGEGAAAMSDLNGAVASSSSSIISWFGSIVSAASSALKAISRVSNSGGGVSSRFNSGPVITQHAAGGFPQEGQFFLAREAGPELVGTIGGRTAVANNEQITQGIANAVYGAFMRALGDSGAVQGSSGPREVSVNVNGREFFRATYDDLRAVQRERGISLVQNYT